MILAATGLLDGRHATTKRDGFEGEPSPLRLMREKFPAIHVLEARLVDEGSVITGGGVTLCIDSTLHLLRKFLGNDVATRTAKAMAYSDAWEANRIALGDWTSP
jgi:transcriptional regulator GlxA family with amidase domain